MITDIYIKQIEEPGYEESSIIEQQEFEILLSQIKMTLLTPDKSVLGEPLYGVDETGLLFDFEESFDATTLEAKIRYQLKNYCTLLKNRDWSIKVHVLNDGVDQFKKAVHVLITVDKKATFVIAYD